MVNLVRQEQEDRIYMKFKNRNLRAIAEIIIGDADHFPYLYNS